MSITKLDILLDLQRSNNQGFKGPATSDDRISTFHRHSIVVQAFFKSFAKEYFPGTWIGALLWYGAAVGVSRQDSLNGFIRGTDLGFYHLVERC